MNTAFSSNRCRLCLGAGKTLHSIFEQQGSIIVSEKIMSIARVTILDNDTLPHFICHKCLVRLKHCYAFKLMCERSDKKLRIIKTDINEPFADKFTNEIKIDLVEIKTENITSEVSLHNYTETHNMIFELEKLPKCEEHVSKYKDSLTKCDKVIPASEELVLQTENIESSDNEENLDHSGVHREILPDISEQRQQVHAIEESEEQSETTEGNHNIQNTSERREDSHSPQKERPDNSEEDEKYDTHGEVSQKSGKVEKKKYTKPNKKHPSQCHECDKVLSSKGEKPFECSTCNKKFAWESSRAQHERIHTGDNRYKCDLCSVSFPTAAQLSYHRRKHTGERYKCEVCEKSYISPGDLSAHVRSKHESGRKYVCCVCGGAFFRADHLKRHMKLHDSEKPFRARAQRKTPDVAASSEKRGATRNEGGSREEHFTSEDAASHVRTRRTSSREREHVCSVCGSRFYRPDHLKRHMKLHIGDIPFIVVTKKKTPDAPDSSVKHTGETHKCKICGISYTSAGYLSAHIRTKHEASKQYACSVCAGTFLRADDLNDHIKLHDSETALRAIEEKETSDVPAS